jgi:hypothetical protein
MSIFDTAPIVNDKAESRRKRMLGLASKTAVVATKQRTMALWKAFGRLWKLCWRNSGTSRNAYTMGTASQYSRPAVSRNPITTAKRRSVTSTCSLRDTNIGSR